MVCSLKGMIRHSERERSLWWNGGLAVGEVGEKQSRGREGGRVRMRKGVR